MTGRPPLDEERNGPEGSEEGAGQELNFKSVDRTRLRKSYKKHHLR